MPSCELAWTALVMAIAGAKNAGAVSYSRDSPSEAGALTRKY